MIRAGLRRWVAYATCTWAVAFGAPHLWWALGVSAGFPGGESSYRFFMGSAWRYIFDVLVVVSAAIGFLVALELLRPAASAVRRWIPRTLAWIAFALLTLRGVAGMIVDGRSDPVWWPAFLVGGILFGGVAWFGRTPIVRQS